MPELDLIVVNKLVRERPEDLLKLIDGEFEYCRDIFDNIPKSRDESAIFKMARDHVVFKIKFGEDVSSASEGDKVYEAFPEYFEKWISLGCPALDIEALAIYLKKGINGVRDVDSVS